jgi:phosphotransferase system IIB component
MRSDVAAWESALGGRANISSAQPCGNRLRVELGSAERIDRPALGLLGVRAIASPQMNVVHLVMAPSDAGNTGGLAQALNAHPD